MKKIITTVGTSIFRNFMNSSNSINQYYGSIEDRRESEWENYTGEIERIKRSLLEYQKENPDQASAEIASIMAIHKKEGEALTVNLLATDSITSRLAAELTAEHFKDNGEIAVEFSPEKDIIRGLQVKDWKEFKQKGLKNLINRIDGNDGISGGYFDNVIFNITGGYKAIIPYMTIMASINGAKTAYIFEDTNTLILLPSPPIKVDTSIFYTYASQIEKIREGTENYTRLKDEDFESYDKLENLGIIEKEDNCALLSPIGEIFYKRTRKEIFTYYTPDDIFQDIQKKPSVKNIVENKFPHKELRLNGTKAEQQHKVFKASGNSCDRVYYLEEKERIYIYKVFDYDHNAHERFIDEKTDKEAIIAKSKPRTVEVK